MTAAREAAVRLLRSGWVPAALVLLLAAVLIRQGAHVGFSDIARFGVYGAGWLVLPGTLVWRAVTRSRGPRPLAEDLAFGTLTGYVLEFPAYMLGLALGVPWLYFGWPVVVLVVSLATRRGRALWRPTGIAMPGWWSWSVSAIAAYVVVWFGHYWWGPFPSDTAGLRRPYVDEPYHLSIATSLKHFFPPKITYVDDTPLEYHWVSHVHTAASSWITGLEPVVILRSFAIPVLFVVVVIALAHTATRLTGARWVGVVAAGMILVAPLDFAAWIYGSGERLLETRMTNSPSAGFVVGALLLGVLLCIEILRGQLRGRAPWFLLGLTMVAMVGAKSTSLPTVMAGLIGAAVLSSLFSRRLDRRATGLAVLAVGMFIVGKFLFFRSGTYGLDPDPFGLTSDRGSLPKPAAALAALSYLGLLSTAAGLFGLLARRGWREAEHLFLIILCASGIGAGLVFHQYAMSEVYFVYVVFVPILLGSALGLHRLVQNLPSPVVRRTAALAVPAALAVGLVIAAVEDPFDPAHFPHNLYVRVLRHALLPPAVALAVGLAIAVVVSVAQSRRSGTAARRLLAPTLVMTLAGLGLAPTVQALPDVVTDPVGARSAVNAVTIGQGGLAAARWIRENTPVDAKVATNVHCERPRAPFCVPRSFWMAGYAERQFLVEGWSYISWEIVGLTSPEGSTTLIGPFWDPERLHQNDLALARPTQQRLDHLRDHYGVSWLLVDRRYRSDLEALGRFADVRFHSGRYTVLELR